jgi:CelD/BcsL family acetyltransferase involved in cellulose biosynthesis
MNADTVQYEIVTDVAAFSALKPQWDALWQRTDGVFSQGYGFCWHSLKEMALPQGCKLRCVTGREDGRLVLVWPLVVYRRNLWTAIRPLGPNAAEYGGTLVENSPDAQARVAAAWRLLLDSVRFDLLVMPSVPESSHLHAVLRQLARHDRSEYGIAAPFAALRQDTDWRPFSRRRRGLHSVPRGVLPSAHETMLPGFSVPDRRRCTVHHGPRGPGGPWR